MAFEEEMEMTEKWRKSKLRREPEAREDEIYLIVTIFSSILTLY